MHKKIKTEIVIHTNIYLEMNEPKEVPAKNIAMQVAKLNILYINHL